MPHTLRLFLTMLLANLGGAIVTFVHFRFLDPSALDAATPPGLAETVCFLLIFAALLLAGRTVARWWSRSVIPAQHALPDDADGMRLRRRAVMVPAFLALLSFLGRVFAAVIWGFIWPALAGNFSLAGALRRGFAMVLVVAPMVSMVAFLGTERIWRERLPLLFPAGDLAMSGARQLRVRTRMQVVVLAMSIVPMLLLSFATFVRVRSLRGADAQAATLILQNLILMQAMLVGTCVLLALLLANFLADIIASPLRRVQRAMQGVGQGHLNVTCPVVSMTRSAN